MFGRPGTPVPGPSWGLDAHRVRERRAWRRAGRCSRQPTQQWIAVRENCQKKWETRRSQSFVRVNLGEICVDPDISLVALAFPPSRGLNNGVRNTVCCCCGGRSYQATTSTVAMAVRKSRQEMPRPFAKPWRDKKIPSEKGKKGVV